MKAEVTPSTLDDFHFFQGKRSLAEDVSCSHGTDFRWNDTELLLDFRTKSFGLDIEPSSQVYISDDRTAKEQECTYLEKEFHNRGNKMIGTSSHSRRMKCDLQQNSPESGNKKY